MKTAISISDPLFKSAERSAKRLHLTRSRFYAAAVSRYVREIKDKDITARLNAVYGTEKATESKLPPVLEKIQAASIPKEKW
jgi:predicted transcriptional regulator